ncbi:hypothetical protein EBX93_09100 [bacterium]|nr:hypothetical protein [bacterium]
MCYRYTIPQKNHRVQALLKVQADPRSILQNPDHSINVTMQDNAADLGLHHLKIFQSKFKIAPIPEVFN